jgi:polynucleotide 5'-kinase involved in rRNA processing
LEERSLQLQRSQDEFAERQSREAAMTKSIMNADEERRRERARDMQMLVQKRMEELDIREARVGEREHELSLREQTIQNNAKKEADRMIHEAKRLAEAAQLKHTSVADEKARLDRDRASLAAAEQAVIEKEQVHIKPLFVGFSFRFDFQ